MLASLLWMLQVAAGPTPAPNAYLYRATLLQAAPGKLLEILEISRSGWPAVAEGGDDAPLVMRHSQGDRWDLLLLYPMESFATFYSADRVERRLRARGAARAQLEKLGDDVSWQEDVLVFGPPLARVRELARAGFFHVEMFESLPGRQRDLYRQREMENAYSAALGLPENLIFARDSGAHWDLFTIGGYRDIKHYAEGSTVPESRSDEAARAAGFDGAKAIGPYLRTLIALHHDTLAVAIK